MNKTEALEAIAGSEGQTVEFKESPGQLKKAIQTLAAFGSQPQGGVVFIGVDDGGTPVKGFQLSANRPEQIANSIKQDTLSLGSAEPLLPELFVFSEPTFLAIRVTPEAAQKGPYLALGERYERVGKSTHRVDMNYRLLAEAFRHHLYDSESTDPLPFRFCERCGGKSLERSSMTDYARDEQYFMIECDDCGWVEWTQ